MSVISNYPNIGKSLLWKGAVSSNGAQTFEAMVFYDHKNDRDFSIRKRKKKHRKGYYGVRYNGNKEELETLYFDMPALRYAFEHFQGQFAIEPEANQPFITVNKGGSAEHAVSINEVVIPDLWHIAMKLKDDGFNEAGDQVLDCWHTAHDLKRHIQEAS